MKKKLAAMALVLALIVTLSPSAISRPGLRDDDIPRICSIDMNA